MRIPRVQFTVRRLMVLVAVVGVAVYADTLRRRRDAYRELADRHRMAELGAMLLCQDTTPFPQFPALSDLPCINRRELTTAYYRHLRLKYERAAARPWLGVEADPPAP